MCERMDKTSRAEGGEESLEATLGVHDGTRNQRVLPGRGG